MAAGELEPQIDRLLREPWVVDGEQRILRVSKRLKEDDLSPLKQAFGAELPADYCSFVKDVGLLYVEVTGPGAPERRRQSKLGEMLEPSQALALHAQFQRFLNPRLGP